MAENEGKAAHKAGKPKVNKSRGDRLKAALKANLQKRKAQARARTVQEKNGD